MTAEATEMVPAKPNRMERRRLETRGKLLAATAELVIRKGIEKTTLDDITDAADLGRRTFYYHFSGKEACIQAAAATIYRQHGAHIEQLAGSDDAGFVVAMSVQVVLDKVIREPITPCLLAYPRLLGGAFVDALGGFMHRDIAGGIESGAFKPAIAPEMLDRMIMWSIVGLIIETFDEPGDRSKTLRDYAQTFLMILGVGAEDAARCADRAMRSLGR